MTDEQIRHKPLCIYHGNCADGFTAAWIVRKALGRALGYEGQDNTVSVSVRRYEAPHGRPIPPWIARLAIMFDRHGVPDEFLASTEDSP